MNSVPAPVLSASLKETRSAIQRPWRNETLFTSVVFRGFRGRIAFLVLKRVNAGRADNSIAMGTAGKGWKSSEEHPRGHGIESLPPSYSRVSRAPRLAMPSSASCAAAESQAPELSRLR